jgi:hypothetical protein
MIATPNQPLDELGRRRNVRFWHKPDGMVEKARGSPRCRSRGFRFCSFIAATATAGAPEKIREHQSDDTPKYFCNLSA